MKKHLIAGGPGTGKTTRLMVLLDEFFKAGVAPNKIALVSFTKKAAEEAASRAMGKFGFGRGDLPFFRTIHSLAFQQLGLGRGDILGRKNYDELGAALGLEFSGQTQVEEGLPTGKYMGDRLLFVDHLARTRMLTLEEQYHELNEDLNWFQLKQFSDTLKQYKKKTGLIDFTDILENFNTTCDPLAVSIAIIDEAQDLSRLQWAVVMKAFANVETIIVAGDDDQAIYRWSGADVNMFLNFTKSPEVLKVSHRLPKSIFKFANQISSQISNRIQKNWKPTNKQGLIEWHSAPDDIDLTEGEWLLLGRNVHLLPTLEYIAQLQGVPYTIRNQPSVNPKFVRAIQAWEELRKGREVPHREVIGVYEQLEVGVGVKRGFKNIGNRTTQPNYRITDLTKNFGLLRTDIWHEALTGIPLKVREYYLSILRNKMSLTAPPQVHINTIHGVKGGEADRVMLLTDMARRTYEEYQKDPEDEHRVFYVGGTRCREELHLVMPQGSFYYSI